MSRIGALISSIYELIIERNRVIDNLLSLPIDPTGFAATVYLQFPVGASATCSSSGANAGCTLQTGGSQNLTAGQTYTLAVTEYNAGGSFYTAIAGGTFDLTITAPVP